MTSVASGVTEPCPRPFLLLTSKLTHETTTRSLPPTPVLARLAVWLGLAPRATPPARFYLSLVAGKPELRCREGRSAVRHLQCQLTPPLSKYDPSELLQQSAGVGRGVGENTLHHARGSSMAGRV